jgi:hypothetical protein
MPVDGKSRKDGAEYREVEMIEQKALAAIVGQENVLSDDLILNAYAGDMSFTHPVRPACVVKPRTTEHIHKIITLAKEARTPLVPVSSGAPHFRGDTVPGTGGAIIVDLSGMKTVIHIDRKNRVAMFEPGVTFEELISAVSDHNLRLNMPLLPRKTKSVVGSMLEREPVLMPKYHWDIADPLSCTEVIFGTGEMFRTGSAAGSGTIEEQWAAGGVQKEAAGPSASSWYRMVQGAQGTMGIVTWASARCELIPALEEPFFISSSSLEKITEMVHWLIRLRLVNECLILNSTDLAAICAAHHTGDDSQIREELPPWVLFFTVAAYDFLPEERISGQSKDMRELCQRLGLEPLKMLGSLSADTFLRLIQLPSGEPYWKIRHRGNCQDIFFLSVYDKLPGLIDIMQGEAAAAGYPSTDIGIYLQPIVQGVNCHVEFHLFFNHHDSKEVERVRTLTVSATKKLMSQGAFFSRPYGECTEYIMNRDAASLASIKKVKAILDPLNIMNPEKLGL